MERGEKTFRAAKRVAARSFEENSNAFVEATAYGEANKKAAGGGGRKKRGRLYVTSRLDACQIDFSSRSSTSWKRVP